MKSKKSVVKDVVKPTAISPKSSFTDPNDPWSAKANVAENITSKRANILKQFYKSKGWNVDYITKNKKVSQSKTGEYEKWKRDHGIYEEDQIDEVRMSVAVKLSRAWDRQRAKSDASERRTPSSIPKKEEPKKQFANDDKKQSVAEDSVDPKAAVQAPADGVNGGQELAPPKKSIKRVIKELHASSRQVQEDLYDWEKDDKAAKPYGKKPTTQKLDGVNNIGDDKPNARLILKGGKTLTGEPRDTVEIDPMLKNRSSMPDYKSMDKIKQKPQEQ
jgi:hypothetical protein